MSSEANKEINTLQIYRNYTFVGNLVRTHRGCEIRCDQNFLQNQTFENISFRLKKQSQPLQFQGINLPPFFAGLLPEGLRLKALIQKTKTSEDDLFSLLAAVGSHCIGDIYALKKGEIIERSHKTDFKKINFYDFFNQMISSEELKMEGEAIAGVQEKISSSMISFPLNIAKKNKSYILKLNPKDKPNLVDNELLSLQIANKCGLEVNTAKIIRDINQNKGLLVERFDRVLDDSKKTVMIHQEDACQFLDRYPSDKYRLSLKEICQEVEILATSAKIEILKVLQVYAFSYLIGNGDLHGKNISLVTSAQSGRVQMSPNYDLLCTYIYKDRKMALKINGRDDNITRKDFINFANSFDIPPKAVNLMLNKLLKGFEANWKILFQIMDTKERDLYSAMATKRIKDIRS